jgi:hypothetical protein
VRTINYRDIAIANPGQLLLALELYAVEAWVVMSADI